MHLKGAVKRDPDFEKLTPNGYLKELKNLEDGKVVVITKKLGDETISNRVVVPIAPYPQTSPTGISTEEIIVKAAREMNVISKVSFPEAELNYKGEVTVSGEVVGRLEGFRFRQDTSSSPDHARKLRQTAEAVLKPAFHLRADRVYNAPDTEFDFTAQGRLMWGTTAVGKLVKGGGVSCPRVDVFVDEEAGSDVADKVRRRLQHFIDRKVEHNFEPLLAILRDKTMGRLARGFAFRLVEGLGVLPRDAVSNDVKDLDHDAQAALRNHGVHFGQFNIFMQPLLKPAPTQLRLVLWSLFYGLQEFPESPSPGLVTIPNLPDEPKIYYTLAGYHPAGAQAIRIDILERLADLLGSKNRKTKFAVSPEMLSITGMTLEQFKRLMVDLGYVDLLDLDNPFLFSAERPKEGDGNGLSASDQLSDGKKPLGLGGAPRSGQVKQSFSHGRTKSVLVETKRKRIVLPAKPDAAGATAAAGGNSHLDDPSKRPAGISDKELERRLVALRAAKSREADEEAARQSEEAALGETQAKKGDGRSAEKAFNAENVDDSRADKEPTNHIWPQPSKHAGHLDDQKTQGPPPSSNTNKLRRHALLIGISEYDDLDELGYARKDAEDIALALVKYCGFKDLDVELMTCNTPKRSRAQKQYIKQSLFEIEEAKGADLFVFGFWGHGIAQNHGELHLTTKDTNKKDIVGTSISLDFIVECVKGLQAKNTLILLDCCQSQPWVLGRDAQTGLNQDAVDSIRKAADRLVSFDDGPEDLFEYRASAIFSACQLGERAYESKNIQNGYFTHYFLEALSHGYTRVTDISQYVSRSTHRAVKKEVGSIQRPWLELKGNSDIELSANSRSHFD